MTEEYTINKKVRETNGPLPPTGIHNQLILPLEQPIIYYRVRAWSVKATDDFIKGIDQPDPLNTDEEIEKDIFPEAPSLSLELLPE